MQHFLILVIFTTAFIGFHSIVEQIHCKRHLNSTNSKFFTYPTVKRIPERFSYPSANGNVTFIDDYVWMEKANETDKDLAKFIKDENILTESYIRRCSDRKSIQKSILDATNYDNFANVQLCGESKGNPTYVYSLTRPGDKLPIWYVATPTEFEKGKQNNMNPPPGRPFLDESLLSADQSANIYSAVISPDAKTFGYLITEGGSELGTWYFRSINSTLLHAKTTPKGGEGRLPVRLTNSTIFMTFQWFSDGSGLIYNQGLEREDIPEGSSGFKVRYHSWGDVDDSKDITIFDAKDMGVDSIFTYFYLSDDDRWLMVFTFADTDDKTRTYATMTINQTISENMRWISLAPDYEYYMLPVTVIDDWFYYQTDDKAPNSKVVKVKLDFTKAKMVKKFSELQDRPTIIDVIKERKDASLTSYTVMVFITAHDKAIVIYNEDGQRAAYLYDLVTGKRMERILQNEAISFTSFNSDAQSNKSIFTFSSYDTPLKIYELEYINGHIKTSLITAQYVDGIKPGEFEMQKLFATSKDGAQVPYFIISKKGLAKDGSRPAYLYAYAAYGDSDNLYFVPTVLIWLKRYQGFFIWCAARGGGAKGNEWYVEGKGVHKQHTIDDIIATSEDIVKRKFTSDGKILIEGGSAGGLAMAGVINQAREGLIGASLIIKGPYDLFQFEAKASAGPANAVEFGDITEPDQVQAIYHYSPYQNIDPAKSYPAILAEVGTEDDVVPASITYKYVAKMQYTHPKSSNPILMYLTGGQGGHLSNDPADEAVHQLCFAELALGIKAEEM